MESNVYLLLGTNQGNRGRNLEQATDHIVKVGSEIIKKSSIYETAPWGITDQPPFLNLVIHFRTTENPHSLLEKLLNIEREMGRKRIGKWGPRIIDIDILFYDNRTINTEDLTIPHPEIQNRMFTLLPLKEIAPNLIHPVFDVSILSLTEACTDSSEVIILEE